MTFANILLPTDYSIHSDYAAEVAQSLARASGGTIHLVHIYAAPATMLPDGTPLPAQPSALIAAKERADAEMAAAQRRFEAAAPGVAIEARAVLGNVLDAILELARSGRFDIVVMGTHGRGGIRRLLMGSVAEAVIRHSPIPVLAVRTPAPAQPTEHTSDATPSHM
jgi:nucleotide-binding universal stress UspA family protein